MRNLRFIISYDGTAYSGFQTQPKGNTIQDKLEQAVYLLTGEKVKVISSGRTDAGVHAKGQVINFTTESAIPIERWCLALNGRLPNDIRVYHADEVPLSFHSRRSAKRKTYCYLIRNARIPDVFHRHLEKHHPTPLDLAAMSEALSYFAGEHDFTSFCSVRTDKESRIRTIYEVKIEAEDGMSIGRLHHGLIKITITGNGFLYNMVRIIVGTLLQVGEGKRKSSEIPELLAARNRGQAGPTAEAVGLMLWNVEYENSKLFT